MIKLSLFALIYFLTGCNDGECIKSHTQSLTTYMIVNNMPIPVIYPVEICDQYKIEE